MGNHAVGAAFVAIATSLNERRKDGETAVEVLDLAADRAGVRGKDAEFDDAFMPGEPMFGLIVEAFGEGKAFSNIDADDEWAFLDGPYTKFRERYGLC